MNVKVFYQSKTGNTKKVAEAMAAAAGCEAQSVEKANPHVEADLVLIGGAVYATYNHGIHPNLKRFIESLDPQKIKRAAVFCTGFQEGANIIMKNLLEKRGIVVDRESFTCKGKFLFFNFGHPDKDDLNNAKDFAGRYL